MRNPGQVGRHILGDSVSEILLVGVVAEIANGNTTIDRRGGDLSLPTGGFCVPVAMVAGADAVDKDGGDRLGNRFLSGISVTGMEGVKVVLTVPNEISVTARCEVVEQIVFRV